MSSLTEQISRTPKKTPRPVASTRPRMPPALIGLAVTQPSASSSPERSWE
jgi:hypothetical protein